MKERMKERQTNPTKTGSSLILDTSAFLWHINIEQYNILRISIFMWNFPKDWSISQRCV